MTSLARLPTLDPTSEYNILVIIYALASFHFCADGSLTQKPVNIEAVVGQRVQLSCSTSEPYYVLWDHAVVGSMSRNYVFFSGVLVLPYSRRFQMDRDNTTGRYDLVIQSVQKEDAGNYRCMDMVGHGEQAEAELIVLDSNPQCNAGVVRFCEQTSTLFEISCTIGFTGNFIPEMKCAHGTGLKKSHSDVTEQLPHSVTYSLWLRGHWPIDDTRSIVCRTYISHVSSMVNSTVMYAFGSSQSLTMDHRKAGNIDCKANSSEHCSYQWIHEDTGVVINSQALIAPNEDGRYKCQATCMLGDRPCRVTPLVAKLTSQAVAAGFFDATTDNEWNKKLIIGPAVGCMLAVAAVFLTMMYLKKSRRMRGIRQTKELSDIKPASSTDPEATASCVEQPPMSNGTNSTYSSQETSSDAENASIHKTLLKTDSAKN